MAIIISLLLSIAFFFSITITMFIISEEPNLNPWILTVLVIVLNASIIYLVIR